MLLIRIRIHFAVLEPDPDPEPGAWKLTKIYKLTWIPAFQKGFHIFVSMFFELLHTLSIFLLQKFNFL